MQIALTDDQKARRAEFRAFVEQQIAPYADQFDQQERLPAELIATLRERGYLGAALPAAYGGAGMDMITYGLLHAELGRGCSSVRSMLTVHDMATLAVLRWGGARHKADWVPRLASGQALAAFGLSEPEVGSDARNVTTEARPDGDSFVINGQKKWLTAGQLADVYLIVAQCDGQPTAFLIERSTPNLEVRPISGMLGLRGAMLAELHMRDCRVAKEQMVGRIGFGFSHVAATALDYGRYTVAWGCVGIAQASLEASLRYSRERKQFGARLQEFQLIQQMLTNMITNLQAAKLMCYYAGYLRQQGDPQSIVATSTAKYFASTAATQAAGDAVQLHGANGCSAAYPVQRYLRDAKIMEIIEGSTQMQQVMIAQHHAHGGALLADDAL